MAQYTVPNQPEPHEVARENAFPPIASPAPLGLNVLAFVTAIIGCYYAGFIVPYAALRLHIPIGAVLLIAGIIMVLAGMWEYRKNSMLTATIFTSYGGFITALGLVFILSFGILLNLTGVALLTGFLGLLFLCWTIFSGVLLLGTLRTNASLVIMMALLFVAYLLLTIGFLTAARPLVIAGGWVAVACGLFSWIAAIASILGSETRRAFFRLPLGERIAAIE
ncbi:MAG TPA: acetate uptake transporter [Ktedonobacteraceae bacterium]|nr:acetate uptake transporter [Ktedonobacteraceae bacterium]